jgi:hypothetical protein
MTQLQRRRCASCRRSGRSLSHVWPARSARSIPTSDRNREQAHEPERLPAGRARRYLLAGKTTVSYADREETYQAGDAFYMTPGHVPAAEAGTEFIQFSPREELAETVAAMRANAQRVMPGS